MPLGRIRATLGVGDDELTLQQKEARLGYLLILPSILMIGVIIIYPVVYNVILSFQEVTLNPTQPNPWIGFEHYSTVLTSPNFWSAAENSFVFTLFSDLLATAGGLAVALLLRHQFRGRRLARAVVLLPYIAPIVAVAFTWQWMLDPQYGIIPYVLSNILNLYSGTIGLRTSSGTAIWVLIIYDAWRYFPFAFLFLMARVQAIPQTMYEAAKIDGAGRIARFKDITLPELRYAIGTVFVLRWIWNFNTYTDVWLFTQQVTTIPIYTYQTAFSTFEQGLAAAISLILFVFLIIFVAVYAYVISRGDTG